MKIVAAHLDPTGHIGWIIRHAGHLYHVKTITRRDTYVFVQPTRGPHLVLRRDEEVDIQP